MCPSNPRDTRVVVVNGKWCSFTPETSVLGKIAATVMADIMTAQYFSADMVEFPDHHMAWFWIGGMALISPIGMIIWRKTFNQSEKMAEDEAMAQVAGKRKVATECQRRSTSVPM